MNSLVTKPKLIVYGVKDFSHVNEILNMGQNLQINNFDISNFSKQGIISLNFAIYQEAVDFYNYLEQEKGFSVELQLVRELHEIPETDEMHFNRGLAEEQNDLSDDTSFKRQSPNTPGDARVIHSSRFKNNGGIFGTITSSMSSGEHYQQYGRGYLSSNQIEVKTQNNLTTGFERISYGSGMEI